MRSRHLLRRLAPALLVTAVGAVLLVLGIDHGALPSARGSSVATEKGVNDTIRAGKLLFVGASYTVGWGATTPKADYADLVAATLRRPFTVNAVAGTGFTNAGPKGQGTFGTRIGQIPVTLDPRIVIIQGGRDDVFAPATETNAVRTTVVATRQRFRNAQVVVLGPIPAHVPVGKQLLAMNSAIATGAVSGGAGYINAIAQRWITEHDEKGFLGRIPGHPDDQGYAYFAQLIVKDLPAALGQAAPPLAQGGTTSDTG